MNKTLIASLSILALLTGCGENAQNETGAHEPAGEAHGHAHGAGGEKRTLFGEHTELFVEFPRLAAGKESAFAAHFTRLADFRALAGGKVSVILTGGGQPDEVFSIDSPSQPGIFRPVATPAQKGERQMIIEVATPEFTDRHQLGPVTVYADRKAADAAAEDHEEDGIAFTKEQQWKVDFATVEAANRPIRSSVAATGAIRGRPDGEALLTAPVAGQLKPAGPFPVPGQPVKKGEVLAHFAPRLGGETDMASLQAAARKAEVAFDLAVRERARMESLFKDEAVPEKRLLAARAGEESARAELDAARGRLDQYGGGGGMPLRSPVSGIVADVRATPGAYVQEGELLFHIADRRMLWLELRVPESEAARLTTPDGAAFRVEGIEQGFEVVPGKNGRLIAVGGAVDAATRTVPVIFEFELPDERIRIGMSARAQVFAGDTHEALVVPASAVLDESGMSTVFVMINGELFERRQVRPGARDGDRVEILDGLAPGERVVSRGAYLVRLASTRTGEIGHGHAH
jgi:RND family efflux transporter MFP subunit